MQQFRFTNGTSVRCTGASSSVSRVTGGTLPSTVSGLAPGVGHVEIATSSAENSLRRQVLQAAAASLAAAVIPQLPVSAAPQQAAGQLSQAEGEPA